MLSETFECKGRIMGLKKIRKAIPERYDIKFTKFIRAYEKAKADGISHLVIAHPHVLGDTYEELIESLWRLSEAKLTLLIAEE